MKKFILFIFIISIASFKTYSQVGINTNNPIHTFHVDADGNTVELKPATMTDDVVITKDGNVGIGTIEPDTDAKLHVEGEVKIIKDVSVGKNTIIDKNLTTSKIGIGTDNPQTSLHINAGTENPFRMSDTTEKAGYLLTCDENGYAFWDALRPVSSIVNGKVNKGVKITTSASIGVPITDSEGNLNLSPGKWLVLARGVTTGNLNGLHMYLVLNRHEADGTLTPLNRVSAYAEKNGDRMATPQFAYLLEIERGSKKPGDPDYYTTFSLGMACSNYNGVTTDTYGGGYFYAIRIDRD